MLNALNSVIDTILRKEDEEQYRRELKSRFSIMVKKTSETSPAVACKGDTEDNNFRYYYAVVDAKSFGKYLIPTYKPVQRPSEDSPSSPFETGKK